MKPRHEDGENSVSSAALPNRRAHAAMKPRHEDGENEFARSMAAAIAKAAMKPRHEDGENDYGGPSDPGAADTPQ